MSFSKKYLLYILLPPALLSVPLAALFLSQVEQFTAREWGIVAGVFNLTYLSGILLYTRAMLPYLRDVEEHLKRDDDGLPVAMSRCLRRSMQSANYLWLGAGIVFSIATTLALGESVWIIRHLAIASMIAAAPAIAWNYGAAKHLLINAAAFSKHVHYVGRRRLTVARKIALVFVGFFIISSVALVQLVSSRVSMTLERLAISSSEERFQRLYDTAKLARTVDAATIDTLQDYVPAGFDVFLIGRSGRILSEDLNVIDAAELSRITALGSGDSSTFISPNVARFEKLPDGSILGLKIPWQPYANIPLQITLYTLVISTLTSALFVAATLWLSRDIKNPLKKLRGVTGEMARGNFAVEPHIFSDDEIGDLVESFAETRDNLRRLLGRIGGSGTTITQGVHVITEGTGALLSRSREQSELTAGSTASLDAVRNGIGSLVTNSQNVADVTQDSSSRALELQASSEEIARSMDYLFQSVEKTSSSTTEMNASANEMSKRTEVLAGIGDEVLSFVAEMDSTIDELRKNAEATAEISRTVREAAASGGEAVRETVEGIHLSQKIQEGTTRVLDDLQRSVGQISGILRVIEEVTEQTNLLALNASIIAAQAGEQGKGFNVVADEIRELAERTRGSTKEIAGIIKAIQAGSKEAVLAVRGGVEAANRNVSLSNNASQSLETIVTSAERSYDMATRISSALGDQAKASRHLHEVTSRMSDHISEITRSTREQARGTSLLAEEAERVREIALQVRTSTDQQSVASRGITLAMEQMTTDAREIRDLLERQLEDTDRIANASKVMLRIAQDNDAIAQQFNQTVRNLLASGEEFESEVERFRLTDR